MALLLSGLVSCGALAQSPPEEAVRIAVTQQLAKVQQRIAEDLNLSAPEPSNFKVKKLDISSRQKVSDRTPAATGYPTDIYRVRGTVETALTTPNGTTEQTGPFEVYLGTTGTSGASGTSPASNSATAAETKTWYIIPPSRLQTQPQ